MVTGKRQDLFVVTRNTNRNEVHYAIEVAADTGEPAGQAPISVYWLMLEKGENVTEPITIFEQVAFGIASQQVAGSSVELKLAALNDRMIRVSRSGDGARFKAFTTIAGSDAELTGFYAHAEAAFLMPKVKYIEIHGIRGGARVTERIEK